MRVKVLLGVTLIAAISWTAMPTHAAFPGTNGKIAFARWPRGSSPYEEIYIANPDGTGQTRLTFRAGAIQSSVAPAFSPDGTRIAFHRYNADTEISDIVIIDAATGGELDSFVAPPDTSYAWPAWSPDSTHLVFSRSTSAGGGNEDLFVLDVATGTPTQVTFTGAYEYQPHWSPDGTQIAFLREVGGYSKTFVADINPTTFALTGVTNVTGPTYSDGTPKWHPTQDKLVLSRYKPGWGGSEIFVENLATGTQQRHTNTGSFSEGMPAYSPDGVFFVYARGDGEGEGDTELIRQKVSTGSKKILTSNGVVDQQPDWGVQPTIVP
jgi:TolB protein